MRYRRVLLIILLLISVFSGSLALNHKVFSGGGAGENTQNNNVNKGCGENLNAWYKSGKNNNKHKFACLIRGIHREKGRVLEPNTTSYKVKSLVLNGAKGVTKPIIKTTNGKYDDKLRGGVTFMWSYFKIDKDKDLSKPKTFPNGGINRSEFEDKQAKIKRLPKGVPFYPVNRAWWMNWKPYHKRKPKIKVEHKPKFDLKNCTKHNAEGYWRLGARVITNKKPESSYYYAISGGIDKWVAEKYAKEVSEIPHKYNAYEKFVVPDPTKTKTWSEESLKRIFNAHKDFLYINNSNKKASWEKGNFYIFCANNQRKPRKFEANPINQINQEHIYSGETVNVSSSFTQKTSDGSLETIKNFPKVQNSQVQAIEFIVPKNVTNIENKAKESNLSPLDYYRQTYGQVKTIDTSNVKPPYLDYANQNTTTKILDQTPRTVPDDVPIGSKYCTATGVFPSKITLDPKNKSFSKKPNYQVIVSNKWKISSPSCRTIAKKPNFQVWNNKLQTEGDIKSSTSTKTEFANLGLDPNFNKTTFGSWAELAVSANGSISNFSSAAGLGYRDYGFELSGGTDSFNMQNLSKLTISNAEPDKIQLGNAGIHSSQNLATKLRQYFTKAHPQVKLINDCGQVSQLNTLLKNSPQKTIVINCDGDVQINQDIAYSLNSGADNLGQQHTEYDGIKDIPQALIFAKNISVAANVKRIDAWLVAEITINTCSDKPINSDTCNNPLTVNGPIFADSLKLNRTAGAWSAFEYGLSGSGVLGRNYTNYGAVSPAEIFNLRADAYLWAYHQANLRPKASTIYTRELAPRY